MTPTASLRISGGPSNMHRSASRTTPTVQRMKRICSPATAGSAKYAANASSCAGWSSTPTTSIRRSRDGGYGCLASGSGRAVVMQNGTAKAANEITAVALIARNCHASPRPDCKPYLAAIAFNKSSILLPRVLRIQSSRAVTGLASVVLTGCHREEQRQSSSTLLTIGVSVMIQASMLSRRNRHPTSRHSADNEAAKRICASFSQALTANIICRAGEFCDGSARSPLQRASERKRTSTANASGSARIAATRRHSARPCDRNAALPPPSMVRAARQSDPTRANNREYHARSTLEKLVLGGQMEWK